MQDAFNRDMFTLSEVNNPRFNGHVQVSPCGKIAGGKRDRKGCTKGKIEAIMKNNIVRTKSVNQGGNKKIITPAGVNHANHKSDDQLEDPYTFSEPEPQSLSLYQAGSSNKKVAPTKPTMVCTDKPKFEPGRIVKPVKVDASKMNKLQADIARSKVIGKRKKLEQVPQKGKLNDCLKRDPNIICLPAKREARKSTWQRERNSKHELLERIYMIKNDIKQYSSDLYPLDSDSDEFDTDQSIYERHWFSKSDALIDDSPRERRVEASRVQMRRRLAQTLKGLKVSEDPSTSLLAAVIAAARRFPNATASILNPNITKPESKVPLGAKFLISGEKCSYALGCNWQSLPCTRHCVQHIMYNVDQRLFTHCTAKEVDNSQCTAPVFDMRHEFPRCARHTQRYETPTQIHMEKHGKKVSKKSRILGLTKNSKRNGKKRKKMPSLSDSIKVIEEIQTDTVPNDLLYSNNDIECIIEPNLQSAAVNTEALISGDVAEVSEEVLALANLDPNELANQATRLLEEHDLTNVLNQISAETFNELFAGIDKNGEYEPTREETEELERALEAVDNDVRSLERMTRSMPLPLLPLTIDPIELLEDSNASETFPAFQNGFPQPATASTDIDS